MSNWLVGGYSGFRLPEASKGATISLKTLQAGRGLAALAVAAFHLSITMGDPRYGGLAVFRDITRHGNLGVDFFFVLSGFIILHAHSNDINQPNRLGIYLRKRFIRLFPIYWLYTVGFVGLLLLGFGSVAAMPSSFSGWLTAISLIRLSEAAPPLTVAWTLFHELAFYVLFALLILNRSIGAVVLVLWAAWCLLAFQNPSEEQRGPLAVYSALCNLNFFLGMGAYLLQRQIGPREGHACFIFGVALLSAALLALYDGVEWVGSGLVLAVSFAAIIAGMTALEKAGRVATPKILSLLGDASYTIYLTHIWLQGLVLKVIRSIGVGLDGRINYLLVFALSTALGVIVYLCVEKPLLDRLRARPEKG